MVHCDYCHEQSELVYGNSVYPNRRDLHKKRFYLCRPCRAWVGCHPNTLKPLGRLADKELRMMKMRAHESFDKLWKEGYMSRKDAYKWLSEEMGLPAEQTHIGMFDIQKCRIVEMNSQMKMKEFLSRR